jgi:hypothetical protein
VDVETVGEVKEDEGGGDNKSDGECEDQRGDEDKRWSLDVSGQQTMVGFLGVEDERKNIHARKIMAKMQLMERITAIPRMTKVERKRKPLLGKGKAMIVM